ncbi:hypothetical protein [Burkholderia ubonensis]|uniref:hypothetical protein n=1 Tax=Burkholderia ubonensis TaxID=101571 RepID=UPI0012FB0002|nr:hypothetical protein [Burkholderia ubonensis]
MLEKTQPLRNAVAAFAGHAIAGSVIFVILALAAFGLGKFVNLLESWGIDSTIAICLRALEVLLFAGDSVGLLVFIFNAMRAAYRELRE